MMKPKVALVKDGFLPAGSENARGRLSGAAIERCKELAASGVQIEGYTVTQSQDSTAPATVNKVKPTTSGKEIADIGEPFHHEEAFQAYHSGNVEVGMLTVCNNCRCSLTYCPCPKPVVNIDHERTGVVVFKPRTSPLATKRW